MSSLGPEIKGNSDMPESNALPRAASTTALAAARLRAAHLLIDDPPPVLNDYVALRLLGPEAEQMIREDAVRLRTPLYCALRGDAVVRSRYAEDRLAAAVRSGTRQYVILGAGLDTFAYRAPAWAKGLRIFELDHAASGADKRARLASARIPLPANLRYVGADLEADACLPALEAAGLDLTKPVFVTCLGVLIYLSETAANAIFALISGFSRGSEFVCEFSRPEASPARAASLSSALARVAAVGEPWRSRFEPDTIVSRLGAAGFDSIRLLFAEELTERYLQGRDDGLRFPSRVVLVDATA
jgi:methyltransferase (TIGR00027 family)